MAYTLTFDQVMKLAIECLSRGGPGPDGRSPEDETDDLALCCGIPTEDLYAELYRILESPN